VAPSKAACCRTARGEGCRLLFMCGANNEHSGSRLMLPERKGLIERNTGGHLALTDRGRAVLRAMLPDL
jgi:hypothetical protein